MTLSELARRWGLTLADVAFLAGLEESTVSRLWVADDWMDRIKGKTLRSILTVVPGVAEYMAGDALRRRRQRLIDELGEVGLQVDPQSFRHFVSDQKIPEQILDTALEAALRVMHGDPHDAARHLARFWNRSHDRALGCLWDQAGGGGVFLDPSSLVEASTALVLKLAESANSYHAVLGHATLAHHIARATGRLVFTPDSEKLSRRTVMAFRSTVIGQIIQTGDLDEVSYYHKVVGESVLLGMVERWAFPTYNRDVAATTDFSLPGAILLRNTVDELLVDLATDNEAYFLYLVRTAVPHMLRSDPTLGLKAGKVRAVLNQRIETVEAPVVRRSVADLAKKLSESA